jgi:hypothetical protein
MINCALDIHILGFPFFISARIMLHQTSILQNHKFRSFVRSFGLSFFLRLVCTIKYVFADEITSLSTVMILSSSFWQSQLRQREKDRAKNDYGGLSFVHWHRKYQPVSVPTPFQHHIWASIVYTLPSVILAPSEYSYCHKKRNVSFEKPLFSAIFQTHKKTNKGQDFDSFLQIKVQML